MKLSETAKSALLPNMWSAELECYLDKAPVETQNKTLTNFVNDTEAMKGWAEDLRHDAKISKDDFPEHAKKYFDTANELEKIILKTKSNS